jgi:hypothetical protein
MSSRARSARRLATLLAKYAGVHVFARYARDIDRYVIEWIGGPSVDRMRGETLTHTGQFPELDLETLVWRRTERATRRMGDR